MGHYLFHPFNNNNKNKNNKSHHRQKFRTYISELRAQSLHNGKRDAAENPGMCLPRGHSNLRTLALGNARREIIALL